MGAVNFPMPFSVRPAWTHSVAAALRHQLGQSQVHTYEFIDGGQPVSPAPGTFSVLCKLLFLSSPPVEIDLHALNPGLEAFITSSEALAYYDDTSPRSVLEAIDDLSEWVAENGPFDGVMGFSQGASLAAMVLARARFANPPPFMFAVFICAVLPFCEKALRNGDLKFLRAEDGDGPVVHVPTAHIIGAKDPHVSHSRGLIDLCQAWGRAVVDHGGGHEIPRKPVEVTHDMAKGVEQIITKASLGQ